LRILKKIKVTSVSRLNGINWLWCLEFQQVIAFIVFHPTGCCFELTDNLENHIKQIKKREKELDDKSAEFEKKMKNFLRKRSECENEMQKASEIKMEREEITQEVKTWKAKLEKEKRDLAREMEHFENERKEISNTQKSFQEFQEEIEFEKKKLIKQMKEFDEEKRKFENERDSFEKSTQGDRTQFRSLIEKLDKQKDVNETQQWYIQEQTKKLKEEWQELEEFKKNKTAFEAERSAFMREREEFEAIKNHGVLDLLQSASEIVVASGVVYKHPPRKETKPAILTELSDIVKNSISNMTNLADAI